MRMRIVGFLGALGLAAAPLAGQGRVEVGTQAIGFSYWTSDELQNGPSETRVNVPGGGLLGRPTIWATMFIRRNIALEPHFSYQFRRDNDFDENIGTVGASLRPVLYTGDPRRNSFYVFADGSLDRSRQLQGSRGDPSDTDLALGGGSGFRWALSDRFGMRLEGLYRYWFDDLRHEVALNLGVGVVAKRR